MTSETFDNETHQQLAVALFNQTWDYMEMSARTVEEDDQMLGAAHASRYLWGLVGTPVHFARGEWQISRVYTLLKRAEPALHHAKRCLAFCTDHELGAFDLAFAHEAMARAYALTGQSQACEVHCNLARQSAESITDANDKAWLFQNIDSIPM